MHFKNDLLISTLLYVAMLWLIASNSKCAAEDEVNDVDEGGGNATKEEQEEEHDINTMKPKHLVMEVPPRNDSDNANDSENKSIATTTTTNSNDYDNARTKLKYIKNLDNNCLDNHCYNFEFENVNEAAFFDIKAEVRINRDDATYDIINAHNYELLIFENSTFIHFPLHLFYTMNIQELDMRNCSIQIITWECFLMAQNLHVLLLTNNFIRTIDMATFKFAINLQYLFLDSNRLEQLYANSFEGLVNLRYLDMSNNLLAQLPTHIFEPLKALEELNLNNNHLRILNNNLFINNLNLRIFRVAENNLQHIDDNILRHQMHLIIFDLKYNKHLRTLVLSLQLHNLVATNCDLTRINIYGYVRNIDLSYNHIMELYFSQPEQLETLNLRNNSLQQIASLTRAIKLEILNLGDNPDLKILPSTWQVNSLKRLDLGNTGMRQLPIEALAKQTQLIYLNISYNHLSAINPLNFIYFEHLTHFDIRGNNWNCYNLNMLMDMLLKPHNIIYGYDRMDTKFPGEYINDIACMYRLDDVDETLEDTMSTVVNNETNDNVHLVEMSENVVQQQQQQQQQYTQEQQQEVVEEEEEEDEVGVLRRELKAIVNIYEQKFQHAYNLINDLNRRLKAFEQLNATLMQHVTITV